MRRLYDSQLMKLTGRFNSSKANCQWVDHCRKNGTKYVGIGGFPLKTAMMMRLRTCPDFASSVYVFSTDSWLKNIHKDHLHKTWGQSASHFPEFVFELAKYRYPNLDPDEKLTFEQVAQIQKDIDNYLEKMGVNLINERVISMTEDPDNHDLLVHLEGKEAPMRIKSSGNYHVLNTARIPVKPPMSPESDNCVQSTDKLYTLPINQTGEILMIGSGRNLDWAVRDFPEKKIIHAHHPNTPERNNQERMDLSALTSKIDFTQVIFDKIEMSAEKGKVVLLGKGKDGREVSMLVPEGSVYSAMGTHLNEELTKNLPQTKVTCLDTVHTPTMQHEGGLTATSHRTNPQEEQPARSRVTLKNTELPHGGFTTSYFAIMNATGPFSMEKNSILINLTAWKDHLINYFIDHNIISNQGPFKETEAYKTYSERLDAILLHFLHQTEATGQEPLTAENIERIVKLVTKQTLGQERTLDFNMDPSEAVAAYFEAQKSELKPKP
jgi:hypothetical protein